MAIVMTNGPIRPPYWSFAERVRFLIGPSRLNISQRELARRAHITEGYASQLLSGKRRPDTNTLKLLAGALPVSYNELAVLCGYAEDESGLDTLHVPPGYADPLRRMLRFPAWFLDRLDRVGDALFYEDVPGSQFPEVGSHEEADEDDEPDDPNTGASGQ